MQYYVYTDGMCILECTSLRTHDQKCLDDSHVEAALRALTFIDENGDEQHPRAYGDPAYAETDVIFSKGEREYAFQLFQLDHSRDPSGPLQGRTFEQ